MMNIALISGGCSGDYSKIVGWRLWTLIKLCVRTKYITHTHTHTRTHTHTHSFIHFKRKYMLTTYFYSCSLAKHLRLHVSFSRHGTALSECGRCSSRPFRLQILGVPKVVRAALYVLMRAICGYVTEKHEATPVCCLAARLQDNV